MKYIIIIAFAVFIILSMAFYYQKTTNPGNLIKGLEIEIIEKGKGNPVKAGDIVSVHYTGTLENGTKFDSSIDRGTPFEFKLGSGYVIQGWELGISGMKVGEKRKLVISPELGYGDQDVGTIPPNSTLIFEVELLEVK